MASRTLMFCLVLLAVAPACAVALQWPAKVSVGLYESGYLYSVSSGVGIDKDVMDEVAKRAGFRVEYLIMPRARIWVRLREGSLMVAGSGIATPEREKFAYFLPYMGLKNYVLHLKTQPVRSAAEFLAQPQLAWGKIRSYTHGPDGNAFLGQLGPARWQETASQDNLYRMLKNGRFTAMFALLPFYAKYLKDNQMEDQVLVDDWFPREAPIPHSLVLSRQSFGENEIAALRKVLEDMHRDGTLLRIFSKYVGPQAHTMLLP
ncbi:MAG: substrate-binding periplasmic protein [Sphingomonadaceae bacterium]